MTLFMNHRILEMEGISQTMVPMVSSIRSLLK